MKKKRKIASFGAILRKKRLKGVCVCGCVCVCVRKWNMFHSQKKFWRPMFHSTLKTFFWKSNFVFHSELKFWTKMEVSLSYNGFVKSFLNERAFFLCLRAPIGRVREIFEVLTRSWPKNTPKNASHIPILVRSVDIVSLMFHSDIKSSKNHLFHSTLKHFLWKWPWFFFSFWCFTSAPPASWRWSWSQYL